MQQNEKYLRTILSKTKPEKGNENLKSCCIVYLVIGSNITINKEPNICELARQNSHVIRWNNIKLEEKNPVLLNGDKNFSNHSISVNTRWFRILEDIYLIYVYIDSR